MKTMRMLSMLALVLGILLLGQVSARAGDDGFGNEGGPGTLKPPAKETATPVPEPGTLILLGGGLAGLCGLYRKSRPGRG